MPSIQGEAMELFARVPPLPINSSRGGVASRGGHLYSPTAAAAAAASTRRPSTSSGGLMVSRPGGGDPGRKQQETKTNDATGGRGATPVSRSRGENNGGRDGSAGGGGDSQVSCHTKRLCWNIGSRTDIASSVIMHPWSYSGGYTQYGVATYHRCRR